MIPSSATCGCGSTTTSSTPTSTVNGTFGCSPGAVACLTVTNGIITSASNSGLSGINGSAGCSGLYVPCITVTNGVVTALTDRLISAGTSGRTQNVTILDAGAAGVPFQVGDVTDEEFTFITDFEPTNARISIFQINTGYSGLEVDLAYSDDNITFVPVGINLPIVGAGNYFITDTGSFSIPGSPSVLYWRPVFKNSTGSLKSVNFGLFNITVWS
jgi:hypothetical protein